MDTGTHVVMGVSLGGLATIDPVIATDPALSTTVMVATIIGSQIPDVDTVLKLRNNAVYIRHHRGITHSLPALIVWPFVIALAMWPFTESAYFPYILLWTFIAVFLHIFVDIFNAYGTQALRPLSNRWIALGVIHIFDPFIFFTHLLAIVVWFFFDLPAGPTFLTLYATNILYYSWRIYEKNKVVRLAKKDHPEATHIFVSPSIHWGQWHLVIRTPELLFVCEAKKGKIEYYEQYSFDPIPDIPIIRAARKDPNLNAFLSFSPTYRWEIDYIGDTIEVRFIDLRYRSKGHYPFVAIVQLDDQLKVLSSYTGWVYNAKKLKDKLNIATD